MEDLRKRLKEKEGALEKKSKQAAQLVAERRQLEQEAGELREQCDLREKRVSLLQRKVFLTPSLSSALMRSSTSIS